MKRLGRRMTALGIMLSLCCLLAVSVSGQWEEDTWQRIPDEMKTHIVYRASSTLFGPIDTDVSVMVFSHTYKIWMARLGDDPDPLSFPVVCWERASNPAWGSFWEGTQTEGRYVVVAVSATKNYEWWPGRIDLTQPPFQFATEAFDFVVVQGPFDGWKTLRLGTTAVGLVRVPSEFNLALPFTLWIGDDSGTIEAFYGSAQ